MPKFRLLSVYFWYFGIIVNKNCPGCIYCKGFQKNNNDNKNDFDSFKNNNLSEDNKNNISFEENQENPKFLKAGWFITSIILSSSVICLKFLAFEYILINYFNYKFYNLS